MANSIYDFTVNDINGHSFNFSKLRGKVILIVNTASKCGFTKQYAELEQLYSKYRDQGLEIIAFPCNQFANQEPGSDAEIKEFCELNYSISFPIMHKVDVNGPDTHPIYEFLKNKAPGMLWVKSIKWNFTKFLISRDGRVILRYAPFTKPLKLEHIIHNLLVQKGT